MNNKAETLGIGILIMAFIAIIVGAIIMLSVGQTVGLSTTSIALGGANSNNTLLAANIPALGASIDLAGQDLLSTPVVVNGSDGAAVGSGNYTISEIVSTSTGVKTISFQLDDEEFSKANQTASGSIGLNITYTYGPDGYINSGAGRSVAGLIIIFMALAIALVALEPTMREKFLSAIGK